MAQMESSGHSIISLAGNNQTRKIKKQKMDEGLLRTRERVDWR